MRIGFVGTGLMGTPMVQRLATSGYDVRVYNRTRTKALRLVGDSVEVAETPVEVFAYGHCTVVMVSDAAATHAVLDALGERPDLHGHTVIQMSTIGPWESRALETRVTAQGGAYLEAPVLGSTPDAAGGRLVVLVGASTELFARWSTLLEHFGPEPIRVGEVGQAAATKLALNQLIASLTVAFSYSLALVSKSGVDVECFMRILRESKLHAPFFDAKLPRLRERRFTGAHFPLVHLRKDVRLTRHAGEFLGIDTTALAGVQALIDRAVALGLGRADATAVHEAVEPGSDWAGGGDEGLPHGDGDDGLPHGDGDEGLPHGDGPSRDGG
jgi:3-hydroxyisobutyrate dehydrogenase